MFITNEHAKYFQHIDTNYSVQITFNIISFEVALLFPTLNMCRWYALFTPVYRLEMGSLQNTREGAHATRKT